MFYCSGHGFGAQILDLDEPSFTIPARYWKDGYDALVKYSDTKVRRLTIKELSRIQTFPDNYDFKGSSKEIIMQIGNAVACKFAYHLGTHIKNILNNIKENNSDNNENITCIKCKKDKQIKYFDKEKNICDNCYNKIKDDSSES